MTNAVRVGRIAQHNGRVHLETDGQGIADNHTRHIPAGRLVAPDRLAQVDTARLCRRCCTTDRIRHAQATLTTATGRDAEAIRALLSRALDAVTPATERAELDALAARMRADLACLTDTDVDARYEAALAEAAATIRVAPTVMAQPVEQHRRTWADLRREFAATHPQIAA